MSNAFTMRIIAMADTHGFHELLGDLPDGDLLLHAGERQSKCEGQSWLEKEVAKA